MTSIPLGIPSSCLQCLHRRFSPYVRAVGTRSFRTQSDSYLVFQGIRGAQENVVVHHHHRTRLLPFSYSCSHSYSSLSTATVRTLHLRIRSRSYQYRNIFIQTSNTPNPESLKFIPSGISILGMLNNENDEHSNIPTDGDMDNLNNNSTDSSNSGASSHSFFVTKTDPASEILRSPLAKSLLDIDGVKAVYLGDDFLTVTKYATGKWKLLRPVLFDKIMSWADSGKPALLDRPEITDTTILDTDDEVVAMIKELMEARIRPAVQEDGGDIRYVGFEEETGIVTVELAGSCVGCPSSAVTLKQGVENMLMHYIPEVTAVVALEEGENGAKTFADDNNDAAAAVKISASHSNSVQKSYEERLAAAGIPFSD